MAYSPEEIQQAMRQAASVAIRRGARLRQCHAELSERVGPAAEMGTGERLREGIGQGMTNVARRAGNLVGPTSDADLASAKESDAALLATGAGKMGAFIGETAATRP